MTMNKTLLIPESQTRITLPHGYAGMKGRDVLLVFAPNILSVAEVDCARLYPCVVNAVESTGSDTTVICELLTE